MKQLKLLTRAVAFALLGASTTLLIAEEKSETYFCYSSQKYSNIDDDESYSSKEYISQVTVPNDMGIMECLDLYISSSTLDPDSEDIKREIIIDSITGKNDLPASSEITTNGEITLKKMMIEITDDEVSILFATEDENKALKDNPLENQEETLSPKKVAAFKIEYSTDLENLTRALKHMKPIDPYMHEALYEINTSILKLDHNEAKEEDTNFLSKSDITTTDNWMKEISEKMEIIQQQVNHIEDNIDAIFSNFFTKEDDEFPTRSVMYSGGKHKGKRHGTRRRKISPCHSCLPHNAPKNN